MPDKKNAETKVVETTAPVEEKKTATKKAAAKKPAEKKTTAAKATAEKKPAEKKATAAKKPAAKKAATAEERKVVIQYNGAEVAGTALIDKAKEVAGVKSAKSVVVYVRPEINKVYYVIDDNTFGNFDLF
jgi:hypothetical protein